MSHTQQTLLVIDLQNDYFPCGLFPLWDTERTLNAVEGLIARARSSAIPVILIQHIADAAQGIAPFFKGAEAQPYENVR